MPKKQNTLDKILKYIAYENIRLNRELDKIRSRRAKKFDIQDII